VSEMTLRIKCFSLVKQETGTSEIIMTVSEGTNSDNFLQQFYRLYPKLMNLPIRMAVNREYLQETITLKAGDEIALIPPVSGG